MDCENGFVNLWGWCFSIDETTNIDFGRSRPDLGEIPPEIGDLTNLTYLKLFSNGLTGEIPSEIWELTNLTYLSLHSNQLSGEIPSEIGNLTNLTSLYLFGNKLTGEIPLEINNLMNLERLKLSHNQFSSISNSICSHPNLNWSLYNEWGGSTIKNNNLCPPYPYCIEDYVGEQDTTNCSTMSIYDIIIPTTYNLSSPYPNPFNPTTTISFSIPQSDIVSLNVYDITGKLVTTLINKQLNIGYHSIDWDGTNHSSGMYFGRMESGDYVESQKLLLVK